jgi:hypothetical protein
MEQAMTTQQVMEKSAADMVCVMLEVHLWSGRRHLNKDDLIKANPKFAELPDKDLLNLGSVKIYDQKDIKAFGTLKGKAERVLARAGLPILGATGVPHEKFPTIYSQLEEIQAKFKVLVDKFTLAFDDRVAAWKVKQAIENPHYAHLLGDMPSATSVAGRISFAFHSYRISAPSTEGMPDLNVHYETQMAGLKGELMSEVAAESSTLMSDYLMGKDKVTGVVKRRDYVTQKTLGPLKRAAEKLRTFSFLDPSIEPLVSYIEGVVNALPPVGQIEGQSLISIWSLARILASPVEACRIADLAHSGANMEEIACVVAKEENVVAIAPAPVEKPVAQAVEVNNSFGVTNVADGNIRFVATSTQASTDLSSLF